MNHVTGVAVDGAHVYWTDRVSGSIGRANIDGSGVNQSLVTGITEAGGVAVDPGRLYWVDSVDGVGRANLDGSGVSPNHIGVGRGPLAVDGGLGRSTSTSVSCSPASVNVGCAVVLELHADAADLLRPRTIRARISSSAAAHRATFARSHCPGRSRPEYGSPRPPYGRGARRRWS